MRKFLSVALLLCGILVFVDASAADKIFGKKKKKKTEQTNRQPVHAPFQKKQDRTELFCVHRHLRIDQIRKEIDHKKGKKKNKQRIHAFGKNRSEHIIRPFAVLHSRHMRFFKRHPPA